MTNYLSTCSDINFIEMCTKYYRLISQPFTPSERLL
jgi:hypothetical protein